MSSSRGMNSRGKLSSLQGENSHFLGVEHLGLFYPFCNGGRDRGHGQNHGRELLV